MGRNEAGHSAASELSGHLLTATAQGFWQPEQAELLAGYVPRYFPAVLQTVARRGAASARVLAQHGFPYYAVNEGTLQAGLRSLQRDPPAADLRRLLADQLDDLSRRAATATLARSRSVPAAGSLVLAGVSR